MNIVNSYTHFSPAPKPRFSFKAEEVIAIFNFKWIGREFGLPKPIRVDQGTEVVSRDFDLWAYQRGAS